MSNPPAPPCPVCSQLVDRGAAYQKYGREEDNTLLPPAADALVVVQDYRPYGSRALQLRQCPACGTYYLYRTDYEYLTNGSEDEQHLTRLTAAQADAYLDGSDDPMNPAPARLACDAILFDLDGVLIDSTPCIVRHWQHWADRHGLDLATIMQHAHGVRTVETMRAVAPHLDVAAEAEQFTVREVADTDGVVAIEGAAALLAALPADDWGIVTSGSTALARARLTRAGLPIPRVLITAEQVSQGKPAPDPYLAGAARLGLPVERCIVIEDAPAGVTSGVAAGMRVVGVGSTHSCAELPAVGATVVTDSLTGLQVLAASQGNHLTIKVTRSTEGV